MDNYTKYFKTVFPSYASFFIFNAYIYLFVCQGVLIKASQDGRKYQYNTTCIVLFMEMTKLVFCLLYSIVCFGAYDLAWKIKVHVKGSCMIKQFEVGTGELLDYSFRGVVNGVMSSHMLFLFTQVMCSCIAGVYNEKLLKDTTGLECHIMIQNIFMYFDSIICNIAFAFMNSGRFECLTIRSLKGTFHVLVLLIILCSAVMGIITSFFLKKLNSILKIFASAIEVILSGIVCWVIFDLPITSWTFLSMCLLIIACWLYIKKPIINTVEHNYTECTSTL